MNHQTLSVAVINSGKLNLSNGLLPLIRPYLRLMETGGRVQICSQATELREDLSRWCLKNGIEYLGSEKKLEGDLHLLEVKQTHYLPPTYPKATNQSGLAYKDTYFEKTDLEYSFDILDPDLASPPEIPELYQQATQNQWTLSEIPWNTLTPLSTPLEQSVAQIMCFLAENEFSAFYLPSRFISRIHPYFKESAQFLSTQVFDEARHIEVFLKRAHFCKGTKTFSAAITSYSLHSLIYCRNFLEASFLLSVLGEGTFIDLLKFIEENAPDEATEIIARKTRNDESRHVHFGMSHVKHAIQKNPLIKNQLEAAVANRSAKLPSFSGSPEALEDSLVILAGKGNSPKQIEVGYEKYLELKKTMGLNRIKRLEAIGFSTAEANKISDIQTPNFM